MMDDDPGQPRQQVLGTAIERIAQVADYGQVDVENSSAASFALDLQGRRWVRKKYVDTGWQPLLAEALGWLLAR